MYENTKLLHKSEYQKHVSPKLQITSGEKHVYETNGMLHKPTVSHDTHGSLSHDDEENTGLRHASSQAHTWHMHFRVTEDGETGNGVSKWEHIKWTDADSSKARASHACHAAESYEFMIPNERKKKYEKKFTFRKLFEPEPEHKEAYMNVFTWIVEEKISTMDIYDKIGYNGLDDGKRIAALNLLK